jgi:uncharacterized protein with HEPN domain
VRDDRERLADVLAAIDRIRRYVQDDRTRFDADELLQSAVRDLPKLQESVTRILAELDSEAEDSR